MATLYLVRHGEPAGTWVDSHDPGLTDLGREQAQTAGDRLRLVQPKHIISSPLKRAYETALPLSVALGVKPQIMNEVAEIPTPANMSLEHRGDWLRAIMTKEWGSLDSSLRAWREHVVRALTKIDTDTAVFSHFIAINAALGAAIGDDRVICFRPAHASITILEANARSLSLVELGNEGETVVR